MKIESLFAAGGYRKHLVQKKTGARIKGLRSLLRAFRRVTSFASPCGMIMVEKIRLNI